MAAPTPPTLVSIVTEALKKAVSVATQADITRASDEWMEEIKNDIWGEGMWLKTLHKVEILVTTNGVSRYPYPTDFSSDLTLVLLDGNTTGTAQDGTISSITLKSDATSSDTDHVGKEFLIYEGTAKNSMSQVNSYSGTTKIAQVVPDFNESPDSTSKYMRVDKYSPLKQNPIWDLDRIERSDQRGEPTGFYPIGDSDNGEFILNKSPYRDSGIPWGMQLRYYANLMKVDLDSSLMSTLYQRWRNLFVQGIYAKKLKQIGETTAKLEMDTYYSRLQALIMRESYGMDLSNLQMTVSDY